MSGYQINNGYAPTTRRNLHRSNHWDKQSHFSARYSYNVWPCAHCHHTNRLPPRSTNNCAILSNLKYIFETAHPTSRERPERSDTFGYNRTESVMTHANKDERYVSKRQLFTHALFVPYLYLYPVLTFSCFIPQMFLQMTSRFLCAISPLRFIWIPIRTGCQSSPDAWNTLRSVSSRRDRHVILRTFCNNELN